MYTYTNPLVLENQEINNQVCQVEIWPKIIYAHLSGVKSIDMIMLIHHLPDPMQEDSETTWLDSEYTPLDYVEYYYKIREVYLPKFQESVPDARIHIPYRWR